MNFNKLVKEKIDPFLKNNSFVLKNETEGMFEYEHNVLRIFISYDFRSSFEVDMTIYFRHNDESYSLSDLEELFYKKQDNLIAVQIVNDNVLKLWVEDTSLFLENNLRKIILNHIKISNELNTLRSIKINEQEEKNLEKFLINDVNRFWNAKDYYGLVQYLSKYQNKINGSIKRKFDYALKISNQK